MRQSSGTESSRRGIVKRFGTLIATLVVLAGCQAADAKKAHAEPVARELIKSGPAAKANDWAPEGKPGPEDTLTVPVGKTLEVTKALAVRNIVAYGPMSKTQAPITVTGNFQLHAPVAWEGTLNTEGLDHLLTAGNRIADIEQREGIIELSEPLHAGTFQWYGSVDTNGHALTVDSLLYRHEGSYTNYLTSTVTSGEYRAYPLKVTPESKDTLVEAKEAAIVVTGMTHGTFEGAGGYYGSVLLEGGETMETLLGTMADDWTDNTPALTVERGSTTTVEDSLTFGPAATTVRSSEPGHPYTFALSTPMETTSTAGISDMHIVGGPLTVHGGHNEGDDEGVIFDG